MFVLSYITILHKFIRLWVIFPKINYIFRYRGKLWKYALKRQLICVLLRYFLNVHFIVLYSIATVL